MRYGYAESLGGTKNEGGGRSHVVTVKFASAIADKVVGVSAEQVNFPVVPAQLEGVQVSADKWQFRTLGRVFKNATLTDEMAVGGAYLFITIYWNDGTRTELPRPDRLITSADCGKLAFCSGRPGLEVGDRHPRNVSSSQTIQITQGPVASTSRIDPRFVRDTPGEVDTGDDGTDTGGAGGDDAGLWDSIPTWGQWTIGAGAGAGALIGLAALAQRLRR